MKNFTAFSLVIAVILCTLISCAESGGQENPDNRSIAGGDISVAEANQDGSDEPERIDPGLPEMDFEGYTFTFLTHRISYEGDWPSEDPIEIVAEEENGDLINDAVYIRNMQIQEKYNISIEMTPSSDERSSMRKAISAGDDIYDAVIIFNNNVPGVVTGDLLVNTDELAYVDLSKPWWDPAVNSMSIANKNFLLAGDMLILDNNATNGLLFNKELMADLELALPYNSVKEGTWTMDKLHELVRVGARDLDGDGVIGVEDRWGFSVYNDTLHSFLVSGGGAFAVKDENDIPYIDFMSQRNLAVLDKAMNLMYSKDYVINDQMFDNFDFRVPFENNRILFLWGRMFLVESFRGMESPFGIVPMPKYDENQEKYHSLVNPYTGVLLGVPKSAGNLNRTSIILEALAAESKYTLLPAYYDVALQRKHVRDDESGEMLDIIFSSRVYDIGGIYNFGNVFTDFLNIVSKYDRNIMSYYDKKSGSMETAIDKVVEIFRSMD